MTRNYELAVWDVAGERRVLDTVEYDVEQHESFESMRREYQVTLVLDAPGVYDKAREALGGAWVETVPFDRDAFAIVDEEGLLKGLPENKSTFAQAFQRMGYQLRGPIVEVRLV